MKTIKVGMVVVIATISMLARANAVSEWISKSISARVPLSSSECVSPKSYTSAIANNVDEEAYIFEVARSNVVCQIPDDAVVGIESSHSNDVVHSVRFSADGIEYVFLAQTRYGRTLPHACFATGYSPLSTKGAVDERVKALFCRGNYRVYSMTNVLDSSNVNVWATLPRVKVEVPWQKFYLFAIDDLPGANWGHPCRYILCNQQATEFVVYYKHGMPTILSAGGDRDRISLDLLYKTDLNSELNISDALVSVEKLRKEFRDLKSNIDFQGDVSHSHFVIISGGGDKYSNGIRFWADAAAMYSTLRLKYNVPASQIYVYISDGMSSESDSTLHAEFGPFVSSPTDLDGDGYSDVDGAATRSNIQAIFSSLSSRLTPSDQLMIFLTSHGGPDYGGGEYDVMCLLGGYDEMRDEELANWTRNINCPIAYAIETCYSGGFIDDVVQYGRRMMATACNHQQSSWGYSGGGSWGDAGVGATSAYNGWAMPFTAALRGYEPNTVNGGFPWTDASSVDADSNNDNFVSFKEAQVYALNNDVMDEQPQFDENPIGAASEFFICKNPLDVTIYFNANGGSVNISSLNYRKGSLFESLPIPVKSGSVFLGWYTSAGSLVTYSSYVPNSSTTLYAHWSSQVGISAALDCSSFAFTASSWRGQTGDSFDGVDAMRSLSIGHNQSAIIGTRVVGPGKLRFKWKVSSERSYDKLIFRMGQQDVEWISGETNWADYSVDIPSGTYDLSWIYSKDHSRHAGQDCGWVDNVVWTPSVKMTFRPTGGSISSQTAYYTGGQRFGSLPRPTYYGHVFLGWYTRATGGDLVTPSSIAPVSEMTYYAHWAPVVSLSAALDAPTLGFTSSGWKGQTGDSYDQVDSARSAPAGHNMSSVLQTELPGSGRISFWWKCSSERGGDRLRLVIDGVQMAVISGETDWQKINVNVGSGRHEVKWVYTKNSSVNAGQDCGWVDKVEWAPTPVTVTFDGNGGRLSTYTGVYYDGMLYGQMPVPIRNGYVFVGWYTDPYYGNLVNASSIASVDVTRLYARYSPSLTLESVMDIQGRTFYTDGWSGQSDSYIVGGSAARSKPITHSSSTYMYTRINGRGTLSFNWRVSSEGGGNDVLRFLIDGVQQAAIAGEDAGWQRCSIRITSSSSHVLKWVYSKNGSVTKGDDCAWVDNLVWIPEVLVQFSPMGGSLDTLSGSFVVGSVFGALPTPTRSGYVFVGWRDQNGRLVSSSTRVTSDIQSLTAQWSPIVSLSAALDSPDLAFYTDGWKGQTADSYDNIDSARAAPIGHNATSTLYTRVVGSGVISFYWKVSSEGGGRDKLRLMVDGVQYDVIAGEQDWRYVQLAIDTAGTHVVRWVYTKNGSVVQGRDSAWVDQVRWEPDPIELEEALDNHRLYVETGAASWQGVGPENAYDGEDCAQSPRIGNGSSTWMQTEVTGSGNLTFWWKVSSAPGDVLRLIIDGEQYDAISGTSGGWQYYSVWLLEGVHTIKWVYAKNASGVAGSDCGWVDQVNWTGGYPLCEDLEFYTDGDADWYISENIYCSGNISHNQVTRMYTTVVGPGVMYFDWMVSSENNFDYLQCYMDGNVQYSVSGSVSWVRNSLVIPSGAHIVEWIYSKDGSVNNGDDKGYVRNVMWERGQ